VSLAGKVAVVTGAGSGIGKSIALRLAREGAALVLVGRRLAPLEAVQAEVRQRGGVAESLPVDLSEAAAAATVSEMVRERFGTLDILVNNAGTLRRNEDITQTSAEQWNFDLAINVSAVFYLCQQAIPLLRASRGCIVNIASQLAVVGAPGYATYAACKGAVLALTRALAMDYAAEGIRVNAVSPGLVDTPMAYINRPGFTPEAGANHYPLRRVGQPDDIANSVVFLASSEAGWITGHNLLVDGGYTAQ
jgi:NAD(P)-dependent dehydrogenase (short-subunit alcohol dehydrogenase family)